MKKAERYLPVTARLRALVEDCSPIIEPGPDKAGRDPLRQQLSAAAKKLEAWLLGFEWQDSKAGYQSQMAREVQNLRQQLRDLQTAQEKLNCLVSLDKPPSCYVALTAVLQESPGVKAHLNKLALEISLHWYSEKVIFVLHAQLCDSC